VLDFAWPWLAVAVLLPLLAARCLPANRERPQAGLWLPFHGAARGWQASARRGASRHLRLGLAVLAWTALVAAACRPQWIGEPQGFPVSGRDLLLALDVSGSMRTRDLEQSGAGLTRLYVVKRVAGEFLDRRRGDRIGLVLFGTQAYVQAPLTFDRATVKVLLGEATPGIAGEQTAIGDAIGLAVKRLRSRPENTRVLILLTDGANTAGEVEPRAAVRVAAAAGVRIHTIGVGAERMLLRRRRGSETVDPSADLDESTLREIARATGGRYFRGRDPEELEAIYRELDAIEPVPQEGERLRPRREIFHLPLTVALVLGLAVAWPALRGGQRSRVAARRPRGTRPGAAGA
jgi:Ca-activated chloride channel family protein